MNFYLFTLQIISVFHHTYFHQNDSNHTLVLGWVNLQGAEKIDLEYK